MYLRSVLSYVGGNKESIYLENSRHIAIMDIIYVHFWLLPLSEPTHLRIEANVLLISKMCDHANYSMCTYLILIDNLYTMNMSINCQSEHF